MNLQSVSIVLLALVLSACSTVKVPEQPLTWFEPPELLEDESRYISSVASATIPMTPVELREFLAGKNSLIKYMEPVGDIAPPVKRVPIEGVWPEQGARRSLVQQDGHQMLERSLRNELTDFRYQVFGLTSGASRGIDHIYADWSLEAVEGGTLFVWTYRVAPRYKIARPFVRRTLNNELQPFMQRAVDRMAVAARTHVAQ